LTFQVKEYGYIPGALPDQHCFGKLSNSSGTNNEAKVRFAESRTGEQMAVRNSSNTLIRGAANVVFVSQATVGGVPSTSGKGENAGQTKVDPMSAAMRGVQDFFTGPQQTMEELSSGAEDGLSSADLEPVVEELEQAFASLAKFLSQLQKRLFGPAPSASQGAQADTSSLVTSSRAPSMMPTGRFVESSSTSFWESSDKPEQESGNLLHPLLLDMRTATRKPRRVAMDFGSAATNAASAANNVTQNLNSAILQLQSSVDGVETSLESISKSATGNGLDLAKLSKSLKELEETLRQAKESASPREVLQPLLDQLDSCVRELRSSDDLREALGDDLREALKIEKAAALIGEAMTEDLTIIDEATSSVDKQAESLSKISQEAVELPMKEVAPALSRVERVQELLQSAMDALGTIGKD